MKPPEHEGIGISIKRALGRSVASLWDKFTNNGLEITPKERYQQVRSFVKAIGKAYGTIRRFDHMSDSQLLQMLMDPKVSEQDKEFARATMKTHRLKSLINNREQEKSFQQRREGRGIRKRW